MNTAGGNCAQLLAFLCDYVEGALPGDQRTAFEGHLARCPECERYVESYRATIDLERASIPDPSCVDPDAEAACAEMPEELVQAILKARRTNT